MSADTENPKKLTVAIWKKNGEIVICHQYEFGCLVEFAHGIVFNQYELGPEYDFEFVGEF